MKIILTIILDIIIALLFPLYLIIEFTLFFIFPFEIILYSIIYNEDEESCAFDDFREGVFLTIKDIRNKINNV